MWILETERLALRQFTSDDVDHLMQIFADPEAMRFYPAPFSREKTAGWIRWSLGSGLLRDPESTDPRGRVVVGTRLWPSDTEQPPPS